MFYDRYVTLCQQKGVSPSRAAQEAGLSKASVSKWKQEPSLCPTANVLGKLSRYFGVSVSELLGDEAAQDAVPEELGAFYPRFVELCRRKGVSPSRAAMDSGLSKSTVTKWKQDPQARPTGTVLAKLAEYFGVSTSCLMGEEEEAPRTVTEEDIKFALFGGSGEITQEMYEEVRSFAAFVKQREAAKRQE